VVLKVGDVVQVGPCAPKKDMPGWECYCTFCASNSTRIGVVIHTEPGGPRCGVALFDHGEWPMHVEDFAEANPRRPEGGIAKVISSNYYDKPAKAKVISTS